MKVAVEGAELHYTLRGEGLPCLVLCGFGTGPTERMMPKATSNRLRLVFVDLRASGLSTGEAADLTFDRLAEDLEAVRKDLGVERVAVLGPSILGVLAIEYGRRRPESVSHVIAVGTPPNGDMPALGARAAAFFEQDATDERKRLWEENRARLTPGVPFLEVLLAQTPQRFFDPRFDPAPLYAEAIWKPDLIRHVLGTLTPSWDITVGATELTVPTYLALGRYDYVVPFGMWDGIAEKIPNLTVGLFERSGHQAFFEEPERFAEAVGEWMAATSSVAA
ncbi:MAG TPA: alpha/beta hydrolase [Thermoanaerobaculia bacterium]|jgi:proline iminopeptidase|nr:alpha/beta hydrolase [Thermoanaerobaculia bacterium]